MKRVLLLVTLLLLAVQASGEVCQNRTDAMGRPICPDTYGEDIEQEEWCGPSPGTYQQCGNVLCLYTPYSTTICCYEAIVCCEWTDAQGRDHRVIYLQDTSGFCQHRGIMQ